MKKIKCLIKILLTPSIWIRNFPSSKFMDGLVDLLIKADPEIEFYDGYKVKFKGFDFILWVANRPYASPHLHKDPYLEFLPSRCKALEFFEWFDKKVVDYLAKKFQELAMEGE